ncbi:MAG: alpha/beta hydrolase [Halodesulfurarchaeum sp.]
MTDVSEEGPHQGQPLETAGTPLEEATAAMVLVHGRGASARSILQFGRQVHEDGLALLAPQAARRVWYPQSFLAPVLANEPGRSSGVAAIEAAITRAESAGMDRESIVLAGFSQGACLVSEFVANDPRRYGGLAVLSGGLLGETVDPDSYDGNLEGTPVFIGCGDRDRHIPPERVRATEAAFETLGGDVDCRLYEGMGHQVNDEEIEAVVQIVGGVC